MRACAETSTGYYLTPGINVRVAGILWATKSFV